LIVGVTSQATAIVLLIVFIFLLGIIFVFQFRADFFPYVFSSFSPITSITILFQFDLMKIYGSLFAYFKKKELKKVLILNYQNKDMFLFFIFADFPKYYLLSIPAESDDLVVIIFKCNITKIVVRYVLHNVPLQREETTPSALQPEVHILSEINWPHHLCQPNKLSA
jgi:hypothetical protein